MIEYLLNFECSFFIIGRIFFCNVGHMWHLYKIERSAIGVLALFSKFFGKSSLIVKIKYGLIWVVQFNSIFLNFLRNWYPCWWMFKCLWLTICFQPWLFVWETKNFDNPKWRPLLNLHFFLIFRGIWWEAWLFYFIK